MPTYKLSYFNGRGRAEIIRLCFAAAGQNFEDVRVTSEEWPVFKPKTPQGSMPVLEIDGKVTMCQSLAIARYLAREFKLYGKNNREMGLVDQIIDTCLDTFTPFIPIAFNKDPEDKATKMKEYAEVTLPKQLAALEDLIKQTGKKGFAVGESVTVADLMILTILEGVVAGAIKGTGDDKLLDKYTLLTTLRKTVEALPRIKAWLEKRPKTDF